MKPKLRASTKRTGVCYKGAILDERNKVVWVCDHFHTNRDGDSYTYVKFGHPEGMSANTCARRELAKRNQGAAE